MFSKPPIHTKVSTVALPNFRISSALAQRSRVQSASKSVSKSNLRPTSSQRQSSQSKQELNKLGMPKIHCLTFVIQQIKTTMENRFIGYNQHKRVQIASLTKIMTCYVALQLIKELQLDINSYFYVTQEASDIAGTSAFLKPFDSITILDLLYGLMLPSGNDAALVIAENLSYLLKQVPNNLSLNYRIQPFIQLMNKQAYNLQMYDTQYFNPHGLTNDQSFSTAADQAKLCSIAIQDP